MMKKFFVLMLAAAALFAACNKDEEVKTPELSVNNDKIICSANGGFFTVDVKSNIKWTVKTDNQSWYSLDKMSGENDGVITVTIDPLSEMTDRNASFEVSGEDLKVVVSVVQSASDQLSVNIESLDFETVGGSMSFSVQSNVIWTIQSDEQTWYSLDKTSGENTSEVTVTVEANDKYVAREAVLTIVSGALTTTVNLSQKAKEAPEVTKYTANISARKGSYDYDVPAGYDFTVSSDVDWISTEKSDGKITVNVSDNLSDGSRTGKVSAYLDKDILFAEIVVNQGKFEISPLAPKPGELLIEEVYFTGSLIEGSSTSSGDQYIRLTNNSDHVIYADRVMFCLNYIDGIKTNVGAHYDYPALDTEGIAVNDMYVIPGSGEDHPILPGESIILAINAQNFKEENPNAFDLSKADFEFNDVNDNYPDTDNPDVEDLVIWFKSSNTITTLHNRGFESYAIVLPPVNETAETIMNNHHWSGTYSFDFTNATTGQSFHFDYDIADDDAFLIPAEWVLDAVNCTTEDVFYRNPWGAAFDAGWTHAGDFDRDMSRFGKSVRRLSVDGKLVDTNNSTNDFIPNATPTLKK